MNKLKCFHHPKRDATHVVNLGSKIDYDTSVCIYCADKVTRIGDEYVDKPTVKLLRARLWGGGTK